MVAIAETLRQKFETSRQDDAISFLPDIFENRAKISTQNKYYDYAAFGEAYAPGTSVSVEQRYTYTGRELNATSGSMFYRYRTYFAGVGRFSSRDPAGYAGGIGLYIYAMNMPHLLTDFYGLDPSMQKLVEKIKETIANLINDTNSTGDTPMALQDMKGTIGLSQFSDSGFTLLGILAKAEIDLIGKLGDLDEGIKKAIDAGEAVKTYIESGTEESVKEYVEKKLKDKLPPDNTKRAETIKDVTDKIIKSVKNKLDNEYWFYPTDTEMALGNYPKQISTVWNKKDGTWLMAFSEEFDCKKCPKPKYKQISVKIRGTYPAIGKNKGAFTANKPEVTYIKCP